MSSAGFLILGMHRSGTSVLARLLQAAGAELGTRLVPGSRGNEDGHWEDAFAVETNDRLLAALGTRWDDPRPLPEGWRDSAAATEARAAIRDYARAHLLSRPLWALKDPRLCLVVELWRDALAEVGCEPAVVVLSRHPHEVADSLAVRDGMARAKGLICWLRYSLEAERGSRGMARRFTTYPRLLADPRGELAAIFSLPGGERFRSDDGLEQALAGVVRSDRRHHVADAGVTLPILLADAWQALSDARAESGAPPALAGLARRCLEADALYVPVLAELGREAEDLWRRTAHAEAEVAAGALGLRQLPAELGQVRELVDVGNHAAIDALSRLGQTMAAMSGRNTDAITELGQALATASGRTDEAISSEIRRMQEQSARALAAAAELQAKAALGEQMASGVAHLASEVTRLAAAVEVERQGSQQRLETLRATEGLLEQARASLDAQQREIARLKFEQMALKDASEQLEAVRRSLSWKITKPFRVLARLLRGQGLRGGDGANLRALAASQVANSRLVPAGVRKRVLKSLWRGLPEQSVAATALPDQDQAAAASLAPASSERPDVYIWAVIDWHFRIQRPQHLARELARAGHRVFYVSNNLMDAGEPGFRFEPLSDSGRLFQVHLNALGAPAIYFACPDADTTANLRASLGELLAWTGSESAICLVQHPFWLDIARCVPNSTWVYDCMDHHAGFEDNAPDILAAEQSLISGSDLLVVTSAWLDRELAPLNRNRALVRNAGEYAHFCERPAEVFRDPAGRKVLGYYGAIAGWFDLALVRRLAEARPDCLVLLVGDDTVDAAGQLSGLDNVQFTGEVPYAKLPYYLHGFDVCLLPFQVIELTLATNPVKVYEYLAAGKPVVSVDLPEIAQFGDRVARAGDADAFVAAVSAALADPGDAAAVESRRAFAREQTWQHRAAEFDQALAALARPKVSVIVVTYNNLDFTRACLASLEAESDWDNLEVIVVDNASADATPQFLREWERGGPGRRVFLNADNLGFAAGNNVGLAAATGDYLVLLNNDTYVTRGWVRGLVNHLRRDPGIGLVGPVTNNIGNEARIEIHYADMEEMKVAAAAHVRKHLGHVFDIGTAAFFCVAMPRSTYERVGPLDEAFGIGFFEDDDYCRRIEQLGLRVACADDVFIHHHLSASFDKLKAERRKELFERNKAIYEAKWGPWQPHAYRGPAAPGLGQ